MQGSLTGNEWTNGAITPSNTTTYDVSRMVGILVLTQGNLTLEDAQGHEIAMTSVIANTILPLKPKKIKAATTASVVVLYQ